MLYLKLRSLPALFLISVLAAQSPPEVFAPANHSVVPPGPFKFIAKSPGKTHVTLDGAELTVASPAPGVVRSEFKLSPGSHEIVARNESGETRIEVFAGKTHGEFQPFKLHPPVATCETCHAVKQNSWALRRASLAPICASCHPQNRFALIHTHNTDLLAECQGCHMPHGSTAAKLLKQPKETACRQCHGQP